MANESVGSDDELSRDIYEKELVKFYKYKFIFDRLKSDLDPRKHKNLEKLSLFLKSKDYLLNDGIQKSEENLLGVNISLDDIELPYSEKKLMRNFLEEQIAKDHKIVQKFNQENSFEKLEESREKFLQLDTKRRELSTKLLELKNKKIQLMQECAQFRVGPTQKKSVEHILEKSELNQMQAKAVKNAVMEDISARIPENALKNVERNIDKILNQETKK